MNTPYIALYPTDFLAGVGHLGNTELGIYWRLLLVYYRDGKPLPFDPDRLRRLAMAFSPEENRAVDAVVSEFFSLSTEPDGSRCWRHKRADVEMARATGAHEKRVAAARATNEKRWGRGSIADHVAKRSVSDVAKRPVSDIEPEPEPQLIQPPLPSVVSPLPENTPAKARAKPAQVIPMPDGIRRQVWEDWLALRKAKKAPVTATVIASAQREASKAGLSMDEFLEVWCARGSQGLQADWLKPSEKRLPCVTGEPAWRTEQRERARAFAPFSYAKPTTTKEVIENEPTNRLG